MWSGTNGFAAVVQKKCQIENQRVFELLKNIPISNQLLIIRLREGVKFVDTYQCMLVGCITMYKLMLHETGMLAEFGNVTTEKIYPMHHSQYPHDLPFL